MPFLVAGPLGLIGLYMRLRLEETPAFQREAELAHEAAEQARAEGGEDPVEDGPPVRQGAAEGDLHPATGRRC